MTIIDKNIFRIFATATEKVIDVITGQQAQGSKHFQSDGEIPSEHLTGFCEFQGDLEGIAALIIPEILARKFANKILLQNDNTPIDENLIDEAVCEIINQFSGLVRTDLSRAGFKTDFSIPEIIVNETDQIIHFNEFESYKIPFECLDERFYIYLSISVNVSSKAPVV